ncbi:MAG: serine/threonine protein kinase [Candidatus Obscuribacterales bacterium]|nr:serine/threonine protein kinase [Candidatus Obscuribacterales bacterium]
MQGKESEEEFEGAANSAETLAPPVAQSPWAIDSDTLSKQIYGGGDSTIPSQINFQDLNAASKVEKTLIGEIIDNQYRITEVLGKGGMSVVYKATHMVLNRVVAIKTMHSHLVSDSNALMRFKQEALAASQLDHPHVIKVYGFGITGGEASQPYIVMDYIQGESLSELIRAKGRLSVETSLKIFIEVCEALSHAHEKGVVHRDLKPSNIMLLDKENDPYYVKLVDFGIAKLLTQEGEAAHRLTQTGDIFGSPLYMSPEQCRGGLVDKRSDVYSLACVFYETLSGNPPHRGSNVFETFHKHISELPASLNIPDVEKLLIDRLDAIIFRALEKDPEKRYQAMSDFAKDLKSLNADLESGLVSASMAHGLAKQKRWLRRFLRTAPRAALLLLISIVLLACVGVFVYFKSAWFLTAHDFEPLEPSWLVYEPPRFLREKLGADERQKKLDDGRAMLEFGKVAHGEDSKEMLELYRKRALSCAQLNAIPEEIDAREKIVSCLDSQIKPKAFDFSVVVPGREFEEVRIDGDMVYAKECELLGERLVQTESYEDAVPLLEKADLIRNSSSSRDSRVKIDLALAYFHTEKINKSLLLLNDIDENEGDLRQKAIAMAVKGQILRHLSKLAEAENAYGKAQELANAAEISTFRSKNNFLGDLSLISAYTALQSGRYSDAMKSFARSAPRFEEKFKSHPQLLQPILDAYAYACWRSGNCFEAYRLRERSLALGETGAKSSR